MTLDNKQVAVFGSTGSIGCSSLEVIAATDGQLQAVALSAHSRYDDLVRQAREFRPRWVIATDARRAAEQDWSALPAGTELLTGSDGIERVARHSDVDIVVAAIVGSAGLQSTWAALEAGKTVALANKETLVMAGPLVTALARRSGATLLPVDSEHSAIFQALLSGRRADVRQLILTASGGPFRQHTGAELEQVTVEQALDHPTWDMGPKITVDSATMMNKALELIEARWLFDIPASQIRVVVHPQSIVHSMVEFADGSVIAQMSPPDMRLPIQYALFYPQRQNGAARRLDFEQNWSLEFEPPDLQRFPALQLGADVAQQGGTAGAVLNAANETAVAGFLAGELKFTEIVPACRSVLEQHNFDPNPSLERLYELDAWARQEVSRWICA